MRKLLVSFATGMALILPTISSAVGLGGIKVYTNLNQRLNAEIPILSVKNTNRKTLQVSMGSNADFARRGLTKAEAVRNVKLAIIHKGGRSYIKVSSTQVVNVPYLNFIVNLNSSEGMVSREYAVFLDPAGGVKTKLGSNKTATTVEKKSNSTQKSSQVAWKKPTSKNTYASQVAVSNNRGGKYGPVRRGETLWSIATHTRPSESVSVKSMMNAIIRANRHAFPNGRVTEMPAGVMLNIPTIKGYSAYSGGLAPMPQGSSVASQKPTTMRPKVVVKKTESKKVKPVKKPKAVEQSAPKKAPVASVIPPKKNEVNSVASDTEIAEKKDATQSSSEKFSDSAQAVVEGAKKVGDDVVNSVGSGLSDAKDAVVEAKDEAAKSISDTVDKVKNDLDLTETPEVNFDEAKSKFGSPEVKVETPEVKVETPEVNFDEAKSKFGSPEVKVETPEVKVETPEVKVETPEVKVETPNITKPKVTPPKITVEPESDTLISGIPDIATYGIGGAGLLAAAGGAWLLSRRKRANVVGKGVVLTDESDLEEPVVDLVADDELFDDNLISDEELVAEVDEDLLLDLDDEVIVDSDFSDEAEVDLDLDADLKTDTVDLEDEEFEIDPFDFDGLEEDSPNVVEVDRNDDLALNLDHEEDLFSEDDSLDIDEDLLTIDDEEFEFDLGDELNQSKTTDNSVDLSVDEADFDLDAELDSELNDELSLDDDLNFTTMDDLDGLEDLSLDLDSPELSTDDEVLGDDFSFDLTENDEVLDDEFSFDVSEDEEFSLDSDDLDLNDETEISLDGFDSPIEELQQENKVPESIDAFSDDLVSLDDEVPDFHSDNELSLDSSVQTTEELKDIVPAHNPAKAQLKLDLAESFISVDQVDRARNLLQEVVEIGTEAQAVQAKSMLDTIS